MARQIMAGFDVDGEKLGAAIEDLFDGLDSFALISDIHIEIDCDPEEPVEMYVETTLYPHKRGEIVYG